MRVKVYKDRDTGNWVCQPIDPPEQWPTWWTQSRSWSRWNMAMADAHGLLRKLASR